MIFTRIKVYWPEKKGFHLTRKDTGDEYIFLHLHSPAEFKLNDEWVKAKEGACILYGKHAYQEFSSAECDLLHDYFHLKGDIDALTERYGFLTNRLYYPRNGEQVTSILQQIEQEELKKAPYYEDFCEAKLKELIILLARSANGENGAYTADSQLYDRFIKLRNEIHSRFDSDLTVEAMAAMVNLSPSRFHCIYKSIFGISPKKDYLNIRIEHAKTLLQQGKFSVSQVAAMAGYGNQYHFIRHFKQLTGVTPGKYLKTRHPEIGTK